jgi:anti-sigma B factor antagonist
MDEMLRVKIENHDGVPVVRAAGEVDVSTAPALRDELTSVPESSKQVVVDLSDVTFLDSTGLGVLIAAMKRLRDSETGGRLDLVVTRPQIHKVLEVTGLTSVFTVHTTLDEALGR